MRAVGPGGLGGPPARMGRIAWIGGAAAAFAAAATVSYVLSIPSEDASPGADSRGALVAPRDAREGETRAPFREVSAGISPKASPKASPKTSPKTSPEETPADFAVVVSGVVEVESPGGFVAEVDADSVLSEGDRARATGAEAVELALPDGTRLFLRPGSEAVHAPAGTGPRSVELVWGCVFAEVEKDARPFVVATALGDVTTLGTRFGVSLDGIEEGEAELAVAVEEGAVRVETERGQETVEAGVGRTFRRGAGACGMSGEECRQRFRWMAEHRMRRGRPGGKPGAR